MKTCRERNLSLLFLLILAGPTVGQDLPDRTRPIEGIKESKPRVHALAGGRIVQAPGWILDTGTVVLRDGIIQAVGPETQAPPDARIWDCSGLVIYPGLIDAASELEILLPESAGKGAAHWNSQVHPELDAALLYRADPKAHKALRELGFTAALVHPATGLVQGTGALVSLADRSPNGLVLRTGVGMHLGFPERGQGPARSYPGSLMGGIALLRQTLLDARWYQAAHRAYAQAPGQERPETNLALAALAPFLGGGRRILFAVDSDLDLLRALAIGKEFDLDLVVRGSGHEYRVLDQIRESRPEIILPLAFPDEPPVASPEEALGVSLRELQHWEAAPRNPARLVEAGIPIAFTTARLEKKKEFPERVRRAIQNGLSEEAALAALTTNPARMLGVEDRLGSIAAGKLANLVVCDGALYAKGSRILATWVDGNRHEITKRRGVEAEGIWDISCRLGEGKVKSFELELETAGKGLSGSLLQDEKRTRLQSSTLDQGRIALVVPGAALEVSGALRLSGVLSKKRIQGHGVLPGGGAFKWSATCRPVEAAARKDAAKSDSAENGKDETPALAQASAPVFPQGAFGRSRIPPQPAAVLVRGATIWTSGPAGRLENASLLIEKGKIRAVGNDVAAPPGALVIDAKGKHVTPGLIDCHSHTAIQGGVNEGTQAVTAEVRIGDVVNCNDINLYRQLAGGLTVANLLHGSANPIGGQNQVIKLRWGLDPEGLKFQGAMPGIKFALGENVKQSNWGDKFTTRYPQTRMGVEQIMRDRFESALAYERAHNDYEALADKKGVIPPRRDLELEALVEVLRGKRIVHCHSYRQDEILMLLRLAASFGFRIGTLQHILEGYKVAEAIAKHGAGASSFSDWWAYKFEVYDAIPYNGALMHDAGVVVSFNSDSSEMARRLNTEAAKAVKYGGLSEEEALRFVTLNPARQLRIDDRVGSLEAGKDADFVIWNDKPLSTHAICEETWIDGRRYFQLEEDRKLRRLARAERSRLIQKVLAASKGKKRKRQGDESQGEDEPGYSCCREELGR